MASLACFGFVSLTCVLKFIASMPFDLFARVRFTYPSEGVSFVGMGLPHFLRRDLVEAMLSGWLTLLAAQKVRTSCLSSSVRPRFIGEERMVN